MTKLVDLGEWLLDRMGDEGGNEDNGEPVGDLTNGGMLCSSCLTC